MACETTYILSHYTSLLPVEHAQMTLEVLILWHHLWTIIEARPVTQLFWFLSSLVLSRNASPKVPPIVVVSRYLSI